MLFEWRNSNESSTEKGEASELGLPTPKGASVAKVGAKIVNKNECVKILGELFDKIAYFIAIMHILNSNIFMFRHYF